MAVGAAWLKAWICENRKNRRLPSLTQRGTHLYVSLRNHCDAAKMSNFFSKGPLRGTKSSVITSRARGLSVLRRKNGFEPRFGAFLANSILGRLVAPQCESHSPHDAASRYNWSKFRTRGRKHTQDTAQMKAGMQKSRKLPDFVVRPAEAHASIFSRKLLLARLKCSKLSRCAAPIRGPRAYGPDLGPPFRTDPPVGLEGSSPTRVFRYTLF